MLKSTPESCTIMGRPPCLLLLFISSLLSQVHCSGVFELSLEKFTNAMALNSDGNCCTGIRTSGQCQDSCRTFFRVCLNHYQAVISQNPKCTFGEVTTPVVGYNSFLLSDTSSSNGFTNPIQLPFDFAWPGTFTLIIEAWHSQVESGPSNDSPRELISQISVQRSAEVGQEWTFFSHASSQGAILEYKYRVVCDLNYYGPECTDLCKPRNDRFGHYNCSTSGTKVCLPGWSGQYCDKAVCLEGCHDEHGYCDEPYECRCRMGWQGALCDQCIPYPGCVKGTCTKAWECNCDDGWGGTFFCNQDLNYCTHHQPCRNDATCTNTGEGSYTCECAHGFTGTNCEIQIDDCLFQPCQNNGTCTDIGSGYMCQCPEGFHGLHCESNATSCDEGPCKNGASCQPLPTGYQCQCPPGYTGVNCESERDECSSQPCKNGGRCIDENNGYRCVCTPGFGGSQCEEDHNDCSLEPCLNGGTCVDMINDFECECRPGFVGSLCQTNLDDCLNWPCANGGTCHDGVNDYTCSCAPGFTGKDCRVNINECEPNPCRNGGNCTDQVNDFGCTCPPAFYGKRCEIGGGGSQPTPLPSLPPPEGSGSPAPVTRDESVMPWHQVLLIVCLGVGGPIVLILLVLVILLWRRRRSRLRAEAEQKENATNEQRNINNKLRSIEQQSNNFKVLNEDHVKCNNLVEQHNAVKECHKDTLNRHRPPAPTHSNGATGTLGHLHRNNLTIKPTIECDPSRLDSPSSSGNCLSVQAATAADVHIDKPINKDPAHCPSRSSIFFLEKHSHLHQVPVPPMRYQEDVLATEV